MRVYIILLNWNGWRNTIECLDSLLRLSFPDYRIVVCDNGSKDESVQEIGGWAKTAGVSFEYWSREASESGEAGHQQVVLIETGKNLGFAGGNNVGIRYALRDKECRYIWLLNNDTVVFPDSLNGLVSKANECPDAGAVASVCYFAGSPSTVQAWAGTKVNLWTGYVRNSTHPRPDSWFDSLYGASMLVVRAAFEDAGLLDSGFFLGWEETEFCLRLRRKGWALAAAPGSRVLHKVNASTGGNSLVLDRYFTTSGLRLLRLHSPAPGLAMSLFVLRRFAFRLLRGRMAQCGSIWRGVLDYRLSRPVVPRID